MGVGRLPHPLLMALERQSGGPWRRLKLRQESPEQRGQHAMLSLLGDMEEMQQTTAQRAAFIACIVACIRARSVLT